jgi:hypothetical protein
MKPLSRPSRLAFLLLVVAQAAHSVEEYATRLYAVFAPARFVSGLVSDDPATGFVIVNASLVALGVWCYLGPVRAGRPSARAWVWGWVALELANGFGHSLLALSAGGYFPGALTGPVLFLTAAWLALFGLGAEPRAAADAAGT